MPTYSTKRSGRRVRARKLDFAYSPGGGPSGPPQEPTDGLPFYLPTLNAWDDTKMIRTDGRPRVFPHYFPIFKVSIDNDPVEATDYYVNNWNRPSPGEGGIHAAYGAFLRDRPIWRAARTGTQAQWSVADARWEIQQAKARGIDGFVVDILSVSLTHDQINTTRWLADAADIEGDFKIILMLDTSGSPLTATSTQIADLVESLAMSGGSLRPSAWVTSDTNKYVLGNYCSSSTPSVATWNSWFSAVATRLGVSGCELIATTSNWSATSGTLQQVAYALGDWGSGDDIALIAARNSSVYNSVNSWGKQHFMPIGLQQVRPKDPPTAYDESSGLLAMMRWLERYAGKPDGTAAIEPNVKFLQPVTWSDFSEGSTWVPSVMHGWSPLDLMSYYIVKLKTGTWPTILQDGIYMSHRPAPIGAVSTNNETKQMLQWSSEVSNGRPAAASLTPPQDKVQAVVLLTAPATVRIWSHNVYTDFSAPAGLSVYSRDLVVGNAPKVEVIRGGSTVTQVTSTRAVASNPYLRDGTYCFFNNLENLALRPYSPSLL